MDVKFQFKLPSNVWDYLPLPTVISSTGHYTLILSIPIPDFLAGLIGVPVTEVEEALPTFQPEPELVLESRRLIDEGRISLCPGGVGGTYFIQDASGNTMGIFKPSDEEPGAPDNPKNIVKTPLLPPGGGYIREVAAYLLDRNHFAGVPETHLLSKVHNPAFANEEVKIGSLQRFVENTGDSSEFGSTMWSVEDVHRIGTLDIRLFNMDRNEENLLAQKQDDGSYHLVPIDHTFCLPPVSALDSCYFVWQYWPQAKKPFSQATKDYVASIDIATDTQTLTSLGLEDESVETMVVTTLLLKEAVAAGWTLFDISCFLARDFSTLKTPSRLEEFIKTCRFVANDRSLSFLEVYSECLPDLVRATKQC